MAAWLGIAVILIGLALIVIEIHTPGFMLGAIGTALLILGIVILMFPEDTALAYAPLIILGAGIPAMIVSILIYRRIGKPENPATTSQYTLVGKIGLVVEDIEPHSLNGKVKIGSEVWSATAPKRIEKGKKVIVKKVEGVHLEVEELGGE